MQRVVQISEGERHREKIFDAPLPRDEPDNDLVPHENHVPLVGVVHQALGEVVAHLHKQVILNPVLPAA